MSAAGPSRRLEVLSRQLTSSSAAADDGSPALLGDTDISYSPALAAALLHDNAALRNSIYELLKVSIACVLCYSWSCCCCLGLLCALRVSRHVSTTTANSSGQPTTPQRHRPQHTIPHHEIPVCTHSRAARSASGNAAVGMLLSPPHHPPPPLINRQTCSSPTTTCPCSHSVSSHSSGCRYVCVGMWHSAKGRGASGVLRVLLSLWCTPKLWHSLQPCFLRPQSTPSFPSPINTVLLLFLSSCRRLWQPSSATAGAHPGALM